MDTCWSNTCLRCGRVYVSAVGAIPNNYRRDGRHYKWPDAYICWTCRR